MGFLSIIVKKIVYSITSIGIAIGVISVSGPVETSVVQKVSVEEIKQEIKKEPKIEIQKNPTIPVLQPSQKLIDEKPELKSVETVSSNQESQVLLQEKQELDARVSLLEQKIQGQQEELNKQNKELGSIIEEQNRKIETLVEQNINSTPAPASPQPWIPTPPQPTSEAVVRTLITSNDVNQCRTSPKGTICEFTLVPYYENGVAKNAIVTVTANDNGYFFCNTGEITPCLGGQNGRTIGNSITRKTYSGNHGPTISFVYVPSDAGIRTLSLSTNGILGEIKSVGQIEKCVGETSFDSQCNK